MAARQQRIEPPSVGKRQREKRRKLNNKVKAFTQNCVSAFFMPCEKSRIIKAAVLPREFWKFYRFQNSIGRTFFCRQSDTYFRTVRQAKPRLRTNFTRYTPNRCNRKSVTIGKKTAAYLIRLSERKRDRLCKSCRRSSFRSHAAEGRKSNILRCPRCRTIKSGLPSGVLRREEQNRARRKSRGGENARKS